MHYLKTATTIMTIPKLIRNKSNKLNSSTESKIYCATTFYAPELITLVSRFTLLLLDPRTHPCTGRSSATKLKGKVSFLQVTIFLQQSIKYCNTNTLQGIHIFFNKNDMGRFTTLLSLQCRKRLTRFSILIRSVVVLAISRI